MGAIRFYPLCCLVLGLSLAQAASSFAYSYKNAESGADYVLVGTGVLRLNLTSVDGDEDLFRDGDEGLPPDFSNRSYLSLYGEGFLNKDLEFTLDAQYDQEDPDQEFTFLMELKKDRNYMILGDHKEDSFADTVFTLSDDKMRGLTLHGEKNIGDEKGFVGATGIAGAVRGASVTAEIRGDGTSGRYRLDEAPVIRGSERIRIEVRDRNNPTRVLSSTTQARGRDYTIDYERGELLFTRPVNESDFRGNPVVIVASYQYDAPGGLYQRSRYGARTKVRIGSLQVGTTYLADSVWDDGFTSGIIDDRNQIVGVDLSYNNNDRHLASIEIARSDTPGLDSSDEDIAFKAAFATTPLTDLSVRGNYWRVGKDFLTFGNDDLGTDSVNLGSGVETPFTFVSGSFDFDLDPNNAPSLGTDMEAYSLASSYLFGEHGEAVAGLRLSRDNIPDDDELPVNHQDTYFASVSSLDSEGNGYMVGTDFVAASGDGPGAVNDTLTSRLVGGGRYKVGQSSITGPVTLQGVYQYEQFDDNDVSDNSTMAHDLLTRIETLPLADFMVFAEAGYNILYRDSEDDFTEQSMIGVVGAEGEINRYVKLDGNVKYRLYDDLIADRRSREELSVFLRWQSRPLDTLRTALRVEYRDDQDLIGDASADKILLGGDIWWDISSDLLFHGSYEREWDNRETGSNSDETSIYDDILLRLDWKVTEDATVFAHYRLEYDELEIEPLDATRVRTTTEMLGVKYRFNQWFEAISAYRRKTVDDDIDNEKMKVYGELVCTINKYLSVSPGFEHSRYDDGSDEYEANVFYVNLIGKL
ncbi:MAG: hypothetical protein CSA20_05925 [Deltaproteobacteria bacterium]|nr:MAG: hypothetical protein CSA20_05925 [Deltaproteobacteria bacterium]